MTTTPQDSLTKICRQIASTEKYQEENPDWPGTKSILEILREREKALANQIQIEIFRKGIDGMKNENINRM